MLWNIKICLLNQLNPNVLVPQESMLEYFLSCVIVAKAFPAFKLFMCFIQYCNMQKHFTKTYSNALPVFLVTENGLFSSSFRILKVNKCCGI